MLVVQYLVLFAAGGSIYLLLEVISRHGDTHWVMGIVGGLCFVCIGLIDEGPGAKLPFWYQCILGGVIITAIELVSGLLINKVLRMDVWDYTKYNYHFMGQICLRYMLLWCVLSGPGMILDDYLRYWLFDATKPHYHFF